MMDFIRFLDKETFAIISSWRQVWLENVFFIITTLGKSYVVILITLFSAFHFWKIKKCDYIAPLLLSVSTSALAIFILKFLINRPRPASMAMYVENLSSFPSGHAAIAVALYGFIGFYVYKNLAGWKKWVGAAGSVILILLIGFSRVYLGVHYLSDVAGGYMLGGLGLLGSVILFNKLSAEPIPKF